MVWYSHLFQNFPQFIVIHIVKSFGIVNKAEIDVFLELFRFFDDPVDVGVLKKELPRLVGAQYATGDQWRNNSRKNEGWSQSKSNTQPWMWLVIEARSDAVKSNIA